jgi:23S rRNA (uracil1939-C5)-methyltransferase
MGKIVYTESMLLTATCRHFGLCGGCVCGPTAVPPAPVPYDQELATKEAYVRELLAPFAVADWPPIVESPEVWYYRNKMEFAFGDWGADCLVLGLRQAGRFDRVVDVETCLLMSEESSEILGRVRRWAKAAGLAGYHRLRHQGDLRYLVLREGKNTEERMAVLLARAPERILPHLAELRREMGPLLRTCWLGFSDALSDVARAEDMRLLWGPGTIDEKLGPLYFRLSPYSFFQTNTRATERLYTLLRSWSEGLSATGALLDVYCGSGGIALTLAPGFDRVIGIDSDAQAIDDARFNAERNQLSNTEFVAAEAEEFLGKLAGSKLAVQLSGVVVDPPRPGLHPKAMQALLELNSSQIAYVSCNPVALARDLVRLVPLYRISRVRCVDLFPHTPHVETLVELVHR